MDTPSMEQHADARFAIAHAGPDGVQMNRAARIMSAQAHASFLSARELLANAQQLADEKIEAAQADYQESCEEGYQAGMEQARQKMTKENIELSLNRRRSLENLEQDLNALVLQTLHQMLGEIDRSERVCLLVREALNRLGKLQGEITLHVHPDLAEQVAASMLPWQASCHEATLKTVADPALAADTCRVVCSSGSVEGNLLQQLAAIESALGGHSGDSGDTGHSTPNLEV